jgi:hypothetical protein
MMKPRNREINIFNLSMLDVISGAMGAFLIIMVILLPYYKKESIDYERELKQSRASEETARKAAQTAESAQRSAEAAARKAEESARAAQTDAQQNRQRAEAAAQQLAKTFLLVHIQWDTKLQDVDLHVVDPSGAEFYFERRTHPGRSGALSVDSLLGPGNEVWNSPSASPGDYRVYANLYNARGVSDTPTVSGSIIHRDGSTALPPLELSRVKQKTLMATVTVHSDGRVSVH